MDNPPQEMLEACPFGIHWIIKEAKESLNVKPGQWFGPQMISVALMNICNRDKPVKGFEIHTCLDGNIFLDKIEEKITNSGSSLLVLVPVRLGLTNIQSAYLSQIKQIFTFQSNVGIAGGKDFAAFYLIGLDNAENHD